MKTILVAASAVAMCAIGFSAQAADYPSKTIEVITHAGAGGGTDVTTRMMMLRSRRVLKTDMVVLNKRGGAGVVSMNYFKPLEADGYTILAFTSGHAIQMAMGKTKLTLDEIRPIARGTDDPQILMVNCKKTAYKTPEEFVAGMKKTKLKVGTANLGDIDQISTYVFAKKGGLIQPTIVPFKGGGEVATQLVAGSVDVGVLNLSEASSQIKAGDICPMVIMSKNRMPVIPDARTSVELGIDAVFSTIRGFVVNAKTDDAKAAKLESGLVKAMNHSVYQAFLVSVGLDATSVVGAKEWGEQIRSMVSEMGPALKEMGLK
ncbi:MAG: tripartite tricarboxylate transporter substrate binding protein [Rhodospirillales bacterium]|jgi:putative tricarboxylic transport membrane protein|nr:tripartite tricarboxylate transporter substrate binding protein [Rhodospirillales bacterium]